MTGRSPQKTRVWNFINGSQCRLSSPPAASSPLPSPPQYTARFPRGTAAQIFGRAASLSWAPAPHGPRCKLAVLASLCPRSPAAAHPKWLRPLVPRPEFFKNHGYTTLGHGASVCRWACIPDKNANPAPCATHALRTCCFTLRKASSTTLATRPTGTSPRRGEAACCFAALARPRRGEMAERWGSVRSAITQLPPPLYPPVGLRPSLMFRQPIRAAAITAAGTSARMASPRSIASPIAT
jgi:hypothetical protein